MATVWKKAVEAVEVGPDTGDILVPLRRVYEKYSAKAEKLYRKAVENADKRKGMLAAANFYTLQSANVLFLIQQ